MRLPFPDLLATTNGRLAAFFLLYVTEGIPLGFTATAMATQMRRQGLGPVAIGAFVGSLYLPWAFKWVAGPFVDTFSSDRFGRRRVWILGTQIGMMATLLIAMPLNLATEIGLLTLIILLHNAFSATQDVAIDALAVGVLPEHERGKANGFMFAGASVGQAIGGSGVLFLAEVVPFTATYWFVVGTILLVTVFVVLPLREPAGPPRVPSPPARWPRSAATSRRSCAMRGARSRDRVPRSWAWSSRCCRPARTRCRSRCSRTSRSSSGCPTTRSRCSTCGRR